MSSVTSPERRLSRRSWLAAIGVGASFGCAARGPGAAPPQVPPKVPADVLPGDLDLVLRVDLAGLRAELGETVLRRLRRQWLEDGLEYEVAGGWLSAAVDRASTGWLAIRPGPSGAPLDHVLLLRGRFAEVVPNEEEEAGGWGPPLQLGGGWQRRDVKGTVSRGMPARLYTRDASVIVLVTLAELDAVERTVERGLPREARLGPPLPPSHGTLGAAARSRALVPWVSSWQPALGRLLDVSRRVSLVLDLDDGGVNAEVDLGFAAGAMARPGETAAAAATAEHLLRLREQLGSLPGPVAQLARGLTVRAEEGVVTARLEIDAAQLDHALAWSSPRPETRRPTGAGPRAHP